MKLPAYGGRVLPVLGPQAGQSGAGVLQHARRDPTAEGVRHARDLQHRTDQRRRQLAVLVDHQVGPPARRQGKQVGRHRRGQRLAEQARVHEGGPLLRADRGHPRLQAADPLAQLRTGQAGRGSGQTGSLEPVARVGARRPQDVVPGRQERSRERVHREHVPVPERRGEQHAHDGSLSRPPRRGGRSRTTRSPRARGAGPAAPRTRARAVARRRGGPRAPRRRAGRRWRGSPGPRR